MGIAASSGNQSALAQEGVHFNNLLGVKSDNDGKSSLSTPSAAAIATPELNKKPTKLGIDTRARVLRKLSFEDVWNSFLEGTCNSFALTPAEMQALLTDVGSKVTKGKNPAEQEAMEAAIKDYVSLVQQLSEKDTSKTFDIMAVCSSLLLLSNNYTLEIKIDQLFAWIALHPEKTEFNYEDFLIAMSSFERGLSHAFGKVACSEAFDKEIAGQWMVMADPSNKQGLADSNSRVNSKSFFDFCLNRQYVVRKLLETLAAIDVLDNKNLELQEVTDTVETLKAPESGDQWMANPAWKKTAERMVTKAAKDKYVNVKPSSNLELDWVHGYRGFDCRNNLSYADQNGHHIVFSAAALGIVQDNSVTESELRKQFHFSEHGDDIICLTSVYRQDAATRETITLVASGEIGKSPAIYLYAWSPASKVFQSLACLKGFHTKGVAQLAFSQNGNFLISIGVEYSVAVYNTEVGSKNFSKMIASSQGPKDRICHITSLGGSSDTGFVSCGEKHAVSWKLEKGTILKQENVKLSANKNKILLSITNSAGEGAIAATSEGDFFFIKGSSCAAVEISKASNQVGHGKVAINAVWSNDQGSILLSGDKDGKIVVWSVASTGASPVMTLVHEFELQGYNVSAHADGIVAPAPAASGGVKGKMESMKAATTPVPAIRSVCFDPTYTKILVGTQTCEIIECSFAAGTFRPDAIRAKIGTAMTFLPSNLVSGHFKDEVWGLSVRPVTAENREEGTQYATVGDDGFLRIWSLEKHKLLQCIDLHAVSRACAYSPDGNYIALGFGGGVVKKGKGKDDGLVRVLRLDKSSSGELQLTQVAEVKEAKQWISVVRYSPDGSTLAVGARDNSIYLYSVANQYKRKAKFTKHNSGINAFDFTADGRYLQSCCSAYEILFSDTATGAQVTDGATRLLDADMHTWTCTLGWSVIGIWSGSMDGSDINSCDRSPSKRYIATCDDFGRVNLFRYPALAEKGAEHNAYNGHSSHVTSVRWASVYNKSRTNTGDFRPLASDDFLISTGGEDKCVFQWRHSDAGDDRRAVAEAAAAPDQVSTRRDGPVTSHDDEIDAPTGGDEFMAVKPWLGAIVPPTAWKTPNPQKLPPYQAALGEFGNQHRALNEELEKIQGTNQRLTDRTAIYADLAHAAKTVQQRMYESGSSDPSAPNHDDLELEWVYGYNGYDCRNNVFYIYPPGSNNKKRLIAYHAAALGVVLDPATRTQRYFRGHNDDIMSMAMYEVKRDNQVEQTLIATGQIGMGNIFVWEAPSMNTLAVMATKQKTVLLLTFSADGRLLISFGEDQSLAVSDWKSQTVLTTAKADGGSTFHLAVWSGGKPAAGGTQFLSAGDKMLKLWTVNGRNVTSTKYTNAAKGGTSTQQFLSCCEVSSIFYVGCEDGSIYIIPADGKGVKAMFDHHPKEVKDEMAKTSTPAKMKKALSVTSMSTLDVYMFSGSKDGLVSVWDVREVSIDPKPIHVASFDIRSIVPDIFAKQIQSVTMHRQGGQIVGITDRQLLLVISTRGCDILEVLLDLDSKRAILFQPAKGLMKGVILRAHCNDELWGIAEHPTKPEFCSVGDDKTLRFFDIATKSMKKVISLGHISRTCCYNLDGSLLALGFGGRVGRGKESGGGIVRLYSVTTQNEGNVNESIDCVKVIERQDAKQWISDVKFSPDGTTLVAAAHDCKIYIYTVNIANTGKELVLRSTFMKHNAVVNHVDLSSDGRFMQSNCSGYELLFCDTTNGKQITSASEVKDVKWHTWTCTLGWPAQGIWATGMDGSDINAVARSHTGHLLATSDDLSKINLYRYPCLDPKLARSITFTGHSSHVMNVKWTCGDECLISAGGNDKCLFQWRHRMADGGAGGGSGGNTTSSTKSDKRVRVASSDDHSSTTAASNYDSDGGETASHTSDVDHTHESLLEGPGGGDESGAVKPWVGAVRPPKNPPPINAKPPAVEIDLQYVHGISCSLSNCRPNLFYNLENQLVFPAAALGVLLERPPNAEKSGADNDHRQSWKQHFYRGHDDDVLCLTMSKDRRFIATGQIASKAMKGKASVIVWDVIQSRLLSRMDACHTRGVFSVAFNPEGTQLVSVGMDDSYTHILWVDQGGSWSRVQKIAEAKGDRIPTQVLRWAHPQNAMVTTNEYHYLSGGNKVLSLWKVEGSTLSKKSARVGKKVSAATYTCMGNLRMKEGWKVVVGTSNGDLLVLEERELQLSAEKAHAKAVYALADVEDGSFIITGGKDCFIRIWNTQLQMITALDVHSNQSIESFDAAILTIDIQPLDLSAGKMIFVVATAGGDVLEFIVPTSASAPKNRGGVIADGTAAASGGGEQSRNFDLAKAVPTPVLDAHCKGELWGLATHPLDPDIFATIGDDSIVRVWSISKNLCLRSIQVSRAGRVLAWHPSGHLLAVGLEEDRSKKEKKGGGGKKKADKSGGSKFEGRGKARVGAATAADEDPDGNPYAVNDEEGGHAAAAENIDESSGVRIYSYHSGTNGMLPQLYLRAAGCLPPGNKGAATTLPSVSDMKFSALGHQLYVGGHDMTIHGFDLPSVEGDQTLTANALSASKGLHDGLMAALSKAKFDFRKHASAITHFDCSLDGKYLQSNDLACELLFFDIAAAKQETSASKIADYNNAVTSHDDNDEANVGKMWMTQHTVFSWASQGIWPANAYDSSEINAIDRHVSFKYLATGEDSGIVRILRYPVVIPSSQAVTVTGHSSHVTNVRWTIGDHLISVGGNDKSVFVWRMTEK